MKCSSYHIITCNCYCLRLNPFFISCEIYFIYIFCENFQKNVKKNHRFHVFVAYINRYLRDQFNKRPCAVKFFFAFPEAAEHCYDALLSRCKVKPWVWKSNHRNALLCKWKSDLYGNSDFWCWVFKVFKRSRKPTAEKPCLENVWFLSKYNILSTNKIAFERTVTLRKFLLSRHQIWCAHAIVTQWMHTCGCKTPYFCIPVNLSIVLLLSFLLFFFFFFDVTFFFLLYKLCKFI